MAEPACCPTAEEPTPEPHSPAGRELPGYHLWPFVEGWLETPAGPVPRVRTHLDRADVVGRWQMRWSIGRNRYRLAPGLYAVGTPGPDSPVLVTANYKMTFDALRRDAAGLDAWILVLETHGINVWCAAGKGTFGTAEIVGRVLATCLARVVTHRRLILPQLGAPGVSAKDVRKGCGFSVVYGPVRSADLKVFLAAGMTATPSMRAVTFTAVERLVLTPVELVMALKTAAWAALALFVLAGLGPGFYSLSAAWERGLAAWGALAVA
ncbi:MAG: mercury methylation corrinoid protein HgcA, partial [Thermodesulfobacteriota bacterium]